MGIYCPARFRRDSSGNHAVRLCIWISAAFFLGGRMLPAWLWLSALVLALLGTLGVFQKLAMNYISAFAALIWAAAGFMLLQPLLFPGSSVFEYSTKILGWDLLNGVF